MDPKIAIIIPALNESKFLPKLLDSLVDQSDGKFETIVVDGQSEDKTVQIAKSYTKKLQKLTVVVSPVRSIPDQRNFGTTHTTADWLVFSDADNILLPYFIERVKHFIKTQKTTLFTTWCAADSMVPNDALITLFSNIAVEGSIMLKRQFTPGPLTIVRRDAFEKVGGYTSGMEWGEDYDLGKRLLDAGILMSVIRETLYVWSIRRFRHEGTLKVARQFMRTMFPILITKKGATRMPGYVMGGHLYSQKPRKVNKSTIRKYQASLKKLLKEFFQGI